MPEIAQNIHRDRRNMGVFEQEPFAQLNHARTFCRIIEDQDLLCLAAAGLASDLRCRSKIGKRPARLAVWVEAAVCPARMGHPVNPMPQCQHLTQVLPTQQQLSVFPHSHAPSLWSRTETKSRHPIVLGREVSTGFSI